jgi:threonine dehydrogenase-like Zn-dependent dehydrogenase
VVYAVYADAATAQITPTDIMRRELRIKGSFAQIDCFPRALAYLESKKVKVDDIVTPKCRCKTIKKCWNWPGHERASRSPSSRERLETMNI